MVAIQDQMVISIYDDEDMNSVLNIVGTGPLFEGIKNIPEHLRSRNEEDFENDPKITDTERALRIQFWQEFNRRQDRKSVNIIQTNIYLGVCTSDHFYKSICTTPEKLAFILLPPRNYETDLRLLLGLCNSKRKEILQMDSTINIKGVVVPNDRLIALQLKIIEMLENRLFGTAIARSASVETQVKADSPEGQRLQQELSHEHALAEIKRLTARVEAARSSEGVIDAEVCE